MVHGTSFVLTYDGCYHARPLYHVGDSLQH
eukprot:SAG31_NODE_13738_length_850_cov_1.234354_2_plen_29_part_01